MPLPKRLVEPVYVSRGTIPDDFPLPSELEATSNGTLANTVRQLSSLSRHAEDLFGELTRDATQMAERANSLQARIDRLAIKVTQLDSTVEEVSLQDIHMRKAFKSGVVFDQHIFSRSTMSTAMLETYNTCDRPPPLDKLNSYRDDGKDGLKFYTDPNYFFELWRQEMLKDTERVMHDRGKKPHRGGGASGAAAAAGGRHKKRVRQPHNTRERQRQIAVGHGEHIMPQNVQYRTGQSVLYSSYVIDSNNPPSGMVLTNDQTLSRPLRPSSIELRRSYPSSEVTDSGMSQNNYASANNNYSEYDQSAQAASSEYMGSDSGTIYNQGLGGLGSPSRRIRPTQPPPAPPSNTPTPSGSASGTPTRGRSMSSGRDQLPPPPPPPEGMQSPPLSGINGSMSVAAHLLGRSNSQSRSASPLHHSISPPRGLSVDKDKMMDINDLPPPPDDKQDISLKKSMSPPKMFTMSPPKNDAANGALPPPPPPLPPPVEFTNGFADDNSSANDHDVNTTKMSPPKSNIPTMNGDIASSNPPASIKILGCTPPKLTSAKDRVVAQTKRPGGLPTVCDPRNDLLKAIRDGIKLRKVEKIEQKEVERSTNALHDVASILARRVAVEFSDSDSATESEYDSDGWNEQETSA